MKPNPNVTSVSNLLLPKQNVKLAELFCGSGGTALGAHLARYNDHGYTHLWATDNNLDACTTFRKNFATTDVVHCDIADFDFAEMSAPDGLVFGFPCNDFSNVGEQKGTSGNFGGLYKHCVRGLVALQPLFFVAENVSGIRSTNKKEDYKRILSEFAACGYDLVPHLYKFEHYAVPQRRHRIIIVGFRKDAKISFEHPLPSDALISAEQALRGISEHAANHEYTQQGARVIERLKHIRPGQNAFNADLPEHLQLNVKGAKMSMIYKRLAPDQPAYTITGSGGGGTHVYHWSENRALTNRERARLQTFPDDFVFSGGKESVRKQIGMAVPPQGAKAVFQRILEVLHKHSVLPRDVTDK